jgi:hypothetical protein
MTTAPRVTVLMTAYNAAVYLRAAVDSILSQTLRDFEFIIVDDGSNDGTASILADFAAADGRVRVVAAPHLGLPAALNRGLTLARGELVARMDADDISRPARLARQLEFMDQHPSVGLCGTWGEILGPRGRVIWRFAASDAELRCRHLFETALLHPSVMFRLALVRAAGGYDPAFQAAEDYDLWVRLSAVTRMANITEPLLLYRRHAAQVSRVHRADDLTVRETGQVRRRGLERLGLTPSSAEFDLHNAIGGWRFESGPGYLDRAAAWLERLQAANAATGGFPRPPMDEVLAERWYLACRHAARTQGVRAARRFWRSPLARHARLGARAWLRLMRQTLLGTLGLPRRGPG